MREIINVCQWTIIHDALNKWSNKKNNKLFLNQSNRVAGLDHEIKQVDHIGKKLKTQFSNKIVHMDNRIETRKEIMNMREVSKKQVKTSLIDSTRI